MSGNNASDLRCVECAKPFGFPVAFCPFCSKSQQASSTDVDLVPIGPSDDADALLPHGVAEVVVPRENGTGEPLRSPPVISARLKPSIPTWFWVVAVVLLMLAIEGVALLMRHSPTATLIVSVHPNTPGAVTIDGKQVGLPGQSLSMPIGSHAISFVAEGWIAPSRQISLEANQQATVTLELAPQQAMLVIALNPANATLRLDDRVIDTSRSEVAVPAGRHQLTATRLGYTPLTLAFTLERGERRVVPLTLAPLVAKVLSLQAPVGAWSQPVMLPPATNFTLAFTGRIRVRIGQEVYFVGSGNSINLGDIHGQSLQVKAVDDQPVGVSVILKPEG